MKAKTVISLLMLTLCIGLQAASGRQRYNFNSNWRVQIGDIARASETTFNDTQWLQVTLPYAFNQTEAFRLSIEQLTDTVAWYRKHFRIPGFAKGRKAFIEFEGVRQRGDVYLNGHYLGKSENGVMAFGFDLTPHIIIGGDNVLAVRVDNNWSYREEGTDTPYQWNNRNFNANYGGIPKNVYLHVTDEVYQTLPLYSNLQTTGVYIYPTEMRVKSRTAVIHAESEVRNDSRKARTLTYRVEVIDPEGRTVGRFEGEPTTIAAGETCTLTAAAELSDLHFWSWGYGYLYTVKTRLVDERGHLVDEVSTRTGFRKTRFAQGKVWLNDRVLMMKGYAQRSSNEWPAVGISVPAWLSDYSNGLMIESGANLVRWMHVTPSKQDVASCDRVGLIQAMPAGDAEKDALGRQWEQRTELMRDAIIYNRNNPSILFYEGGNESISREHMMELRTLRDRYDPWGGRAVGSREMLDIQEAEYGGEMLYINKSAQHPVWAMEYCRDEGLRKYWDDYSYPFHQTGDGPLYRNAPATAYNHNQDLFTAELVRRWYDYWRVRPGTGMRISAGGVKIIFSDSNTHYRGAENYRRSGVTDPMRIAKDGFFAHQVMWRGWVDNDEQHQTHIVGHWNYPAGTVKPVYVVSSGEAVELFINGRSLGRGRRDYHFLYTFPKVPFEAGQLEAVSYDATGRELSRSTLTTAGEGVTLKLTVRQNPEGFRADGADMALIQFEVIDVHGNRCPLDNRPVSFTLQGEATWLGGIAQGEGNYILHTTLPVECGVNRALLRSTTRAGKIRLTARAEGLPEASIELQTQPAGVIDGLSDYKPDETLRPRPLRGPTPLTPSYIDTKVTARIVSATAGSHAADAAMSFDDNELSEWSSEGNLQNAWITYHLERRATIDEVSLKLTGWRSQSYPLEIYADDKLVWKGLTPTSLGYTFLRIAHPVTAGSITIRLADESLHQEGFDNLTELSGRPANQMDSQGKRRNLRLRIVEVDLLEHLNE
ncbi:MAG: DUF4982 domain-containing protein [Prevotellaceae bacterium]|jgi:hypothetical protein|nr:DUF4982 domain-containing protein [Prevotellaceae bacterium]